MEEDSFKIYFIYSQEGSKLNVGQLKLNEDIIKNRANILRKSFKLLIYFILSYNFKQKKSQIYHIDISR